ncbi:peptide-N4-asparagine amidase [Allorhizocola rhizosphaerae]|uniref:peptide-N4-asparagine amidase n=1 Tax=Allorhizocola rhizosphaerae TaxID=1872709 RepID=UPI000E3CD7F1|nr:peptide-N4-asparagine amidase [Allorhizocola rhizosphaerae]
MRRILIAGIALLGTMLGSAAHAAPPPEFGNDWDDPRVAAPPIPKPPGRSCTVRIVDNQFKSFDPFEGTFAPPAGCAGPWAKVVLTMHAAVKGRQFDRLGHLAIGGVTVFKTSTPQPSPEGIRWTVEKDITAYSPILGAPQPVMMRLDNVVDETYTGILDVQVDLTFWPGAPPEGGPDDVLTPGVALPRNTERLLAEVYVTGSGGGCEEFWYITAPPSSGYSCPADNGPYREVQILVDGQVAGIAAPFPHIYTGGWSNPFLWYVIPAPRAFDVAPVVYDLSPFVGRLTDGRPHEITVSVVGVPAGQPGWEAPVNLLAWRDPGSAQVTGDLLASSLSPLRNEVEVSTVDGWTQVAVEGGRKFSAVGYVQSSRGRLTYVVGRELANTSRHRWQAGENPDALKAGWTDTSTVVVAGRSPSVTRHAARYTLDGVVSVSAENRLTTTMTATDAATHSSVGSSRPTHWTLDDTYTGEATWTLGVPRPDRHGVGFSRERYQLRGTTGCYDRTIATVNGFVTNDTNAC